MMKLFVSKPLSLLSEQVILSSSILDTFGDSETSVNFHHVEIRLDNKMGSVPTLKNVYDKPRNARATQTA